MIGNETGFEVTMLVLKTLLLFFLCRVINNFVGSSSESAAQVDTRAIDRTIQVNATHSEQ